MELDYVITDRVKSLIESARQTKAAPLDCRRVFAFFNEYVSQLVEFINRFAVSCEEKLIALDFKLNRLERLLVILEAKIGSAGVAEVSKVDSTSSVVTPTNVPSVDVTLDPSTSSLSQPPVSPQSPERTDPAPADSSVVDDKDGEEARPSIDEDLYGKYVKMLHFGVPIQALRLKMSQDNVPEDIAELILKRKS